MVGGILFKTIKSPLGSYAAFRASKHPPLFVRPFEDSAALIGIVIAAFETFAAQRSTCLSLSKRLLIGERADRKLSNSLLRIAEAAGPTSKANGVLTVRLASD